MAEESPRFEFQSEFRWFGESALRPVHELNARVLELLVKLARNAPIREQPALSVELASLLQGLDIESVRRAASCPIALVDARFGAAAEWSAVAAELNIMSAPPAGTGAFPEPEALELSHITLTLAWAMARESIDVARIVFGMDRRTAELLSRLGTSALQQLADRVHRWISPRWEDDLAMWRTLLLGAQRGEQRRLPSVAMRLMQRQLADLEPATRGDVENRGLRR